MPKPTKPVPTLAAQADTIPIGSNIHVTGAGFEPNQDVILDDSHMNPVDRVTASTEGTFSHDLAYIYTGPGNAGVKALVERKGKGWVEVARVIVEVVTG